jgi:hypothetical protein
MQDLFRPCRNREGYPNPRLLLIERNGQDLSAIFIRDDDLSAGRSARQPELQS